MPVKHDYSPFNKNLKGYFEKRDIKEFDRNNVAYRQKLVKKQKYKCSLCSKSIADGTEGLELHHKIPRVQGGSNEYKNIELVHISCHLEYHKVFPARDNIPNNAQLGSVMNYINRKKIIGLFSLGMDKCMLEPYVLKGTRVVLRGEGDSNIPDLPDKREQ